MEHLIESSREQSQPAHLASMPGTPTSQGSPTSRESSPKRGTLKRNRRLGSVEELERSVTEDLEEDVPWWMLNDSSYLGTLEACHAHFLKDKWMNRLENRCKKVPNVPRKNKKLLESMGIDYRAEVNEYEGYIRDFIYARRRMSVAQVRDDSTAGSRSRSVSVSEAVASGAADSSAPGSPVSPLREAASSAEGAAETPRSAALALSRSGSRRTGHRPSVMEPGTPKTPKTPRSARAHFGASSRKSSFAVTGADVGTPSSGAGGSRRPSFALPALPQAQSTTGSERLSQYRKGLKPLRGTFRQPDA